MRDLTSHKWMYAKAALLVVAGSLAGFLLFLELPTARTVILLGIVIWGFCRAYYFVFYVLERYVDPAYRFSGLLSFARHLLQKRRATEDQVPPSH